MKYTPTQADYLTSLAKDSDKIIAWLKLKTPTERACLLGEGYAIGSKAYKESVTSKEKIDGLNSFLYDKR